MRAILNVSWKESTISKIKQIAKERNFKSVSEYVFHAIELEQKLTSEEEVFQDWQKAKKKQNSWTLFSWLDLLKSSV